MKSTVKPTRDEPVELIVRKGEWHHSAFPHPLVTVDFDKDGNLLGVSVVNVKELSWYEDPV